jgi:hypothetical protein
MEDLKKSIQALAASNDRLEKQLAAQEEKSSRSGDNKMGQHQLNNAPAPRRSSKPPLSAAVPNNTNKRPRQERMHQPFHREEEAASDDQSSVAGSSVGSHPETREERRAVFMEIRR